MTAVPPGATRERRRGRSVARSLGWLRRWLRELDAGSQLLGQDTHGWLHQHHPGVAAGNAVRVDLPGNQLSPRQSAIGVRGDIALRGAEEYGPAGVDAGSVLVKCREIRLDHGLEMELGPVTAKHVTLHDHLLHRSEALSEIVEPLATTQSRQRRRLQPQPAGEDLDKS